MQMVIVVLVIASTVLPIVGLGRALLRANANVRYQAKMRAMQERAGIGLAEIMIAQASRDETAIALRDRRKIVGDIVLVGVGLCCGAAASIWALFI
jgi:hypothetical protein